MSYSDPVDITNKAYGYFDVAWNEWLYNAKRPMIIKTSETTAIVGWYSNNYNYDTSPTMHCALHFVLVDCAGADPVELDRYTHELPTSDIPMDYNGGASTLTLPDGDGVFLWSNYVSYDPTSPYGAQIDFGAFNLDDGFTEADLPTSRKTALNLLCRIGVTNGNLDVKWVRRLGDVTDTMSSYLDPFATLMWDETSSTIVWCGCETLTRVDPATGMFMEYLGTPFPEYGNQFHWEGNNWVCFAVQSSGAPDYLSSGAYMKGTFSPLYIDPVAYPLSQWDGFEVLATYNNTYAKRESATSSLILAELHKIDGSDNYIRRFMRIFRVELDAGGDPQLVSCFGTSSSWWWQGSLSAEYGTMDRDTFGPPRNMWARSWSQYAGEETMVIIPNGGVSLAHFGYPWYDKPPKMLSGPTITHDLAEYNASSYKGLGFAARTLTVDSAWPGQMFNWDANSGWEDDSMWGDVVWCGGKYLHVFDSTFGDDEFINGAYRVFMALADPTVSLSPTLPAATVWDGAQWRPQATVWDGAQWEFLKVWDGTDWQTLNGVGTGIQASFFGTDNVSNSTLLGNASHRSVDSTFAEGTVNGVFYANPVDLQNSKSIILTFEYSASGTGDGFAVTFLDRSTHFAGPALGNSRADLGLISTEGLHIEFRTGGVNKLFITPLGSVLHAIDTAYTQDWYGVRRINIRLDTFIGSTAQLTVMLGSDLIHTGTYAIPSEAWIGICSAEDTLTQRLYVYNGVLKIR